MKKIFFFFFFLCGCVHAETWGNPGCFAVAAEWLYVMAAIDQPYYVITSNVNPTLNGERHGSRQKWHSGYRVEALYRFCDKLTDIRLRWTHVPKFADKNLVNARFLSGVFVQPAFALSGLPGQAFLRDTYNVFFLDCFLGRSLIDACHFRFVFQGGLQYGYATFFEEAAFFVTPSNVVPRVIQNRSKISGVGPALGIDFSYNFWKQLCLTGRGSAAFLISNRGSSFFDNSSLLGPNRVASVVTNGRNWVVIPTSDFRLGIACHAPFNLLRWFNCSPLAGLTCLHFDLEIGYEVIAFYKAVDRIFFVDDTNRGSSTDELMDLTFHGPYVHLGLSF